MRLLKLKKFFTMIELLIVIVVMMILMYFTFQAYTGFILQGKIVKTRLLLNSLNNSLAKLILHVDTESRVNGVIGNQHPLFAEGYKANRCRTIIDKDFVLNNMTANPLQDLISKADLAFEKEGFQAEEIEYFNGTAITVIDAFDNPIMLVRNEIAYQLKIEEKKENLNYREDVYKDREKTYVMGYMMYQFDTTSSGKNLYEWNDSTFNREYSILKETPTGRYCDIYDKIMVPYTKNGFDLWSAGPDGKIANLIPKDYKEDRWKNFANNSDYAWVSYPKINSVFPLDTDNDNISEIKGSIDNDRSK